jgi:insertion element IS1 protein InsB
LVKQLNPSDVVVELRQHSEGTECDEMWSFVGSKAQQRWLWYAIDHKTGKILAYVLGDRKDTAFLKLKKLLEPFGITRFYTDDWGAYERHIEPEKHIVGKENTQKIERKNLTFRTRIKRLVRKTISNSHFGGALAGLGFRGGQEKLLSMKTSRASQLSKHK